MLMFLFGIWLGGVIVSSFAIEAIDEDGNKAPWYYNAFGALLWPFHLVEASLNSQEDEDNRP